MLRTKKMGRSGRLSNILRALNDKHGVLLSSRGALLSANDLIKCYKILVYT